ncbi:MAG: S8 family serine peptidase, partial [Bdellovibrionaceae bacterium]|nr:S8 family serine peptidase [Pseudobdellovibrionaceae bacterium]
MQTVRVQARVGEDVRLPPSTQGNEIIVAVLDTGVDVDHPDLRDKILRKDSECRALAKFLSCVQEADRKSCEKIWMNLQNPEVDQDGNGYPLDCYGWSL